MTKYPDWFYEECDRKYKTVDYCIEYKKLGCREICDYAIKLNQKQNKKLNS